MKKNVSSPPTVHGLDWLHGKSGGHQVVSVVSPPAHHQQTLDLPHHKDQTALYGAGDTQRRHYTVSIQIRSERERGKEGFQEGLSYRRCTLMKQSYLLGQQTPGVLTAQTESLQWELH